MMKKYCAVILFTITLFINACSNLPSSPTQNNTTEDNLNQLIIIHTNDIHGKMKRVVSETHGYSSLAQIKKDYEDRGLEVILLDAGDTIHGTSLTNYDEGLSVVKLMNDVGYSAMVPGNHEFDYGLGRLIELRDKMNFPLLAANIYDEKTNDRVFDSNMIITTKQGIRLGIFGLSTPETMTLSHPKNVEGLAFDEGSIYQEVQNQIDQLKDQNCDIIICLGHLGTNPASEPYRSEDVILNTTGIDLFIDGHSHTVLAQGKVINDTLLVSAGELFHYFGVVEFQNNEMRAKLVSAEDYSNYNADIEDFVSHKEEQLQDQLELPIGESEVSLKLMNEDGSNIINAETNLGDLTADAMLYFVKENFNEEVDAAIMNGGGIREAIDTGIITRKKVQEVLPFSNEIVVLTIKGEYILEALEAACFACPDEAGAFPQVAGLTFELDTKMPYNEGEAYPDSTFYAPQSPGQRVKSIAINGSPFESDHYYKIAVNDFMAAGGDSYYAFTKSMEIYSTGITLENALSEYISQSLKGVIGKNYNEPDGRITIH